MSNLAFAVNVFFEPIHCSRCGKYFAIDNKIYNDLRKSHDTFTCPYCKCDQHFTGKSEEQKLKNQLAIEKRSKEFAQRQAQTERDRTRYQKNCVRAQKAANTRMKNRMKNGVCPCCNRTFKQLASHMKNKHPDYMEHKK